MEKMYLLPLHWWWWSMEHGDERLAEADLQARWEHEVES